MFGIFNVWTAETELDNFDDREGVYFFTIGEFEDDGSMGREWAVVIHRVCDGRFPLDGAEAEKKVEQAQFMVDSMNQALQNMGG
jgi:hypothetical protein